MTPASICLREFSYFCNSLYIMQSTAVSTVLIQKITFSINPISVFFGQSVIFCDQRNLFFAHQPMGISLLKNCELSALVDLECKRPIVCKFFPGNQLCFDSLLNSRTKKDHAVSIGAIIACFIQFPSIFFQSCLLNFLPEFREFFRYRTRIPIRNVVFNCRTICH